MELSEFVKDIYGPMIRAQYPDEVEQYGLDAVVEALGKTPACATQDHPEGCGHEGCHHDCGCVCS